MFSQVKKKRQGHIKYTENERARYNFDVEIFMTLFSN